MSVKQDALADLIALTINNLPKQEFEVGWDSNDFEACRIYQKDRMVVDGGTQIEREIMLDHSGNARYRRAYDTDNPKAAQVMHVIKAPWARLSTDYSWDDFEILQNKNGARGFINLMKVKRTDGLWAWAELIEDKLWLAPDSATDDLHPYGVPYFLTWYTDASGTVNSSEGFVGQAVKFGGGTYSTVRTNIDSSTEAKWRNYAAIYTAVDNALLKQFRLAFGKTKFKAPYFMNDPQNKRAAAKRVYTDFDTQAELMDLADQKDDRHSGKDVLSNIRITDEANVLLNRLPVIAINQLDGVGFSPIYCINFEKFVPFVHDGYWMKEGSPITDRGQHTTYTVFMDGAHNNICLNMRTAGFVCHKSA